jgi:glycosyltransferase involved in cell wall biosynthesis
MRILTIHNHYQQPGGEDAVFAAESDLLAQHGHAVHRLEFDNHRIPARRSLRDSARLAVTTVRSPDGMRRVREAIDAFAPDVAHFHNTFPLVSPAAYGVCQRAGVAVVQTLHNYRLLCPSATFFRAGRPCEDCLGHAVPYPGIVHGCYRQSRGQTAVVAAMLAVHRFRGTWQHDVDRYIALTDFARDMFVAGGLPAGRIVVKPNFVAPPPAPDSTAPRTGFLFVGRLAPEKGIATMLDAWTRGDLPVLTIAGDGPLSPLLHRAADTAPVQPLGRLAAAEVLGHMRSASALIFPSIWYEGFPVTIAEAYACSTPIIASRIGAMAEIIEDGVTGLLVEPGNADDLAAKVRWAGAHPEEMRRMGENARRAYEATYTPERSYAALTEIYRQAVTRAGRRSHAVAVARHTERN